MGTLRRATVADAADLTRLRGLMHASMGEDPSAPGWFEACEKSFTRRLAEPDLFAGFLVEVDGRVVSCGTGWVEEHLPQPRALDPRRGQIASMSTEPGFQRRGFGALVFGALMGWFEEQDVSRVDLRATLHGRPLYEAFGFRVLGGTSMAWTRADVHPALGYTDD